MCVWGGGGGGYGPKEGCEIRSPNSSTLTKNNVAKNAR